MEELIGISLGYLQALNVICKDCHRRSRHSDIVDLVGAVSSLTANTFGNIWPDTDLDVAGLGCLAAASRYVKVLSS